MGFRHTLQLCVTCTVIDVSTALISWVQAWLICSKLFAVFYVFLCVYSIYRFIMYIRYRNMHHCLASLCRTYTHYIQVCNKQFILLSSVDLLGHIYTAFVEMVYLDTCYLNIFLFEHFLSDLSAGSKVYKVTLLTFDLWLLTGVWQVSVHYEGEHISGSPFNIKVFDPNAVRVFGLEGGTVGMGLNFTGIYSQMHTEQQWHLNINIARCSQFR